MVQEREHALIETARRLDDALRLRVFAAGSELLYLQLPKPAHYHTSRAPHAIHVARARRRT